METARAGATNIEKKKRMTFLQTEDIAGEG